MPVPGEENFVPDQKSPAPRATPQPTPAGPGNGLPKRVRAGLAKARDAHLKAVALQQRRSASRMHYQIPDDHEQPAAMLPSVPVLSAAMKTKHAQLCLHPITPHVAQKRRPANTGRNKVHSLRSLVS